MITLAEIEAATSRTELQIQLLEANLRMLRALLLDYSLKATDDESATAVLDLFNAKKKEIVKNLEQTGDML